MTIQLRKMKKGRSFQKHILIFLAPALILYSVFMIFPLLDSIRLSLFASTGPRTADFVGLLNFKTLLTNSTWAPRFWGALQNNFTLFLIHMLVQIPVALLLAACLNVPYLRWGSMYRTLLFTPAMLSIAIVGFIWQLILNPLWGFSKTLMNLVGMGSLFRPWLGLQNSALPTISLISVWQFLGIPMLLFVTALIMIPNELIEAARVDGANAWDCFWRIQFPLILPTIGIVTILTYTGNMNGFDLVFAVEGPLGGPNYSTDLMGTLLYRTFFGFQNGVSNPYMGSTIASMMFAITMIGVLIYLFIWQRRIVSYGLKMGVK